MDLCIAVLVGLLAGVHTSTWGMYKDSPHEGFTWRTYLRSAVLSTLIAAAWQAAIGFDLASAGARLVLFGLTYVSERGLVELYKTFLREEDQSKYTIPMQFHVRGRVVRSRRIRWAVAAGWVAVVVLVGAGLVALTWSLLVACFTTGYLFVVLCGLGYTVATIETYKTFFFPGRPRGKFAGKPVLYPRLLTWRHRFAPVYAAIWLAVLANLALAWTEPRRGLLGSSPARGAAHVSVVSGPGDARVAAGR